MKSLPIWILRKKAAYRDCFTDKAGNLTMPGEIVIADLIKKCNLRTPTVAYDNNGKVDPIATAINEGKRQVLNYILLTINKSNIDLKEREQYDE